MEYKVEYIRMLAAKYFNGETTLAEEKILRDFFGFCRDVPEDLQACRALFAHHTATSAETSHLKLALHTEPSPVASRIGPLYRWMIAAGVAAAVLGVILVQVIPTHTNHSDFLCYVNGVRITDRQEAMEYSRQTFDKVSVEVQRSVEGISEKMQTDPGMRSVGEILNGLAGGTDPKTDF